MFGSLTSAAVSVKVLPDTTACEAESEVAFSDYEPVKGVLLPMEIAYGAKNEAEDGFRVSFTGVELNVAVSPSLFEMPR